MQLYTLFTIPHALYLNAIQTFVWDFNTLAFDLAQHYDVAHSDHQIKIPPIPNLMRGTSPNFMLTKVSRYMVICNDTKCIFCRLNAMN